MRTEITPQGIDMVMPCTLTLYRDGCAHVAEDEFRPMGLECDYIPKLEITSVENGDDHEHDHGMIGGLGAFPAYARFLQHFGLLPWSR